MTLALFQLCPTQEVSVVVAARPKKLRQFRWCVQKRISIKYTMYRDFWEQDQQAPVMEEMTRIGQIQVQSLFDQEMAEMSYIKKMSYLQSRMHFDESMESKCRLWSRRWRDTKVADFITVWPQSFWETRCKGHSRKWGKCTNVSFIRSGSYPETGCIVSLKRNEERDQMWSSVFGNANPSYFSGTLLAGSKYRSLAELGKIRSSQRRNSCRVSQQVHRWSTKTNGGARQGSTRSTTRICWISWRTSSITRGIDTKGECSSRYADSKYARIGQDEESASTTSWPNVDSKIKRESRDYSTAHFPIAANARTGEFYEQFWGIPGYWTKL